MSTQTPFTTKRALRHYDACEGGYTVLCEAYPDRGDDDPITLAEVLRSNGIEDAVWALRAALGDQGGLDRRARLFACACIREIKVDGSKTLWDVLSAAGRAAVEAAEGLTADPPLVDVGPYTDSSTQCSALIAANAAYYAFGWEAANCATIRILNVALSVAFERAAEGGQGIGAAVSGARAAVEAALSRIFRVQILGEHDEKDLR